MPPTKLILSLQALRRRLKMFGIVYGAGLVVATAVGLLLAVVLIDWALALPTPIRLVVNGAALVTLAYALYHWVAREAMRTSTLGDLAGRLEHVFPQFEDSLRSTVDFISPARSDIPGSALMKQRTINEAHRRAADVDIDRALVIGPVLRSSAGAIAALALLAGLLVLADRKFPDFLRIAANHLVGGADPWPKSVEFDLLGQTPRRVVAGQRVDFKIRLTKGSVGKAVVRYRFDNGPWQSQVMERAEDGTFSTSVDARLDGAHEAGHLQATVVAGDDSRDVNVEVVPRLDLKAVEATVTPPAYAKLPPATVEIAQRPVVAVTGSTIDLSLSFNKPLAIARGVRLEPVEHGRSSPAVTWTFPRDGVAVAHFAADAAHFKANEPFKFTVRATDQDGFENTAAQEFSIIVHDDALPSVVIEEPSHSEDRTPDATAPIKAVAEDDFDIDVAQLVVTRVTAPPTTRPAGDASAASTAGPPSPEAGPASADASAAPDDASAAAPRAAAPEPAPTTKPARRPTHWVIDLHDVHAVPIDAPSVAWSSADSSTERKRFRLEYDWSLGLLPKADLQPGDELEVYVQVKDNFALPGAAPHPFVASNKVKIFIISHDQWEQVVETTLAQMRQEIGAIKRNQDVTHDENVTQAKATADKQKFDDAQRATVSRLAAEQSTAAAQTKQSAQKLESLLQQMTENKSPEKGAKATASEVAKMLEQTSEGAMKKAAGDLNQAKETPADPKASPAENKQESQKASQAMSSAAQNQEQASKELGQAMNKLSDFGGLTPMIEKMQRLADEQRALDDKYKKEMRDDLGKTADQLSPEQKDKLGKMSDAQRDLKKATDQALNQMDAKADKMAKTDESSSKAMKDAAQTGKQQGIPQKQQSASDEMQQNQQANAQSHQKEVEIGLDMVIEKLKEAQRQQLAQLQAKLAELQERVGELVARQASHNLDDLWLQDPTGKRISSLSEKDRDALFSLSRRDPKAPIKADLAVLTPSQEQTQRACRDLAEKAGALSDPLPASKLVSASTQMEQAIVFLRKAQLADAYHPNQEQALALLLDAQKAIDEAKKKVDEQERQQKEETIKQAYVEILKQQQEIDARTLEIDKSPRDDDGNLGHREQNELNGLPGTQGKLADKTKALDDKLSGIGSVVYVWANKDIVSSMGDVKDDLAKPTTGAPTQAEQKRIEQQLDAMIKNLAQKKKQQPFANRSGGGGGGGTGKKPPPQMPTDVELRLLKALQQAVNGNTVKLDARKDKDAHDLMALGNRQGELRDLLDQLLRKATKGKVKLGKEPADDQKLPEEASDDQIDDQEFINQLLDDKVDADDVTKKVGLLGDRMGRSRIRIAKDHDPGKVTQKIQDRIVSGLDDLIALAQKQQQQQQGQPQQGQGEKDANAGENQGSQQATGANHQESGASPAQSETLASGGSPQADLSHGEITEHKQEWGKLSPRERQAIMEGAGEKSLSKYDKFIKDYYRELAKKASERQ